jgi:type I restriction enzyme S subunit
MSRLLPAGWSRLALSDLGDWTGGGTPSKKVAAFWEGGTIPWLSPKDMKSLWIYDTQDHITEAAVAGSAAKRFAKNSIAIVVRSGILSHTLPVAFVGCEGTANQDMRVLTPRAELDVDWVFWALVAAAETIRRTCQKDGTTVASIDVARMQQYEIAVPPRNEQQHIAATVKSLLQGVATGRSHVELALSGLATYRASILEAAVRGRLSEDWREANDAEPPDVRAAEGRRRAETSAFKPPSLNPVARFGDLPTSWDAVPLGLLLTDLQYGTSKKSTYESPGTPVLRIPNVSGGIVTTNDLKFADLDERERESLSLGRDDLLVIRSNGSVGLVGKTVRVTEEGVGMSYAGYLIRLRVDKHTLAPEYLELALASPSLRQQVEAHARSTSGVHNINSAEVRGLGIPLPPLEEQYEIVRRSRQVVEGIERARLSLSENLERADNLRRAILRDSLRGFSVSVFHARNVERGAINRVAAYAGSSNEAVNV